MEGRFTWVRPTLTKGIGIYITKRFDGMVWLTIELWVGYLEIDLWRGKGLG